MVFKNAALSAWLVLSLAASGIALAQEEPEMSNQALCELEAEEAGMMNEDDIRDYVEQCLNELRQQNESESSSSNWE